MCRRRVVLLAFLLQTLWLPESDQQAPAANATAALRDWCDGGRTCLHGATCTITLTGAVCTCTPNYTGARCQTRFDVPVTSTTIAPPLPADDTARLDITPPAFLPSVTRSVQLTCRPKPGKDVAQVMTLQLLKYRELGSGIDSVASYVTTGSPTLEAFGVQLGASISGSHNVSHPELSFLTVTLPQPTETAHGRYRCEVDTLDSRGLVQKFHAEASLVSLAKNSSVPQFYYAVLKELRVDLDTLTSDLNTVHTTQAVTSTKDNKAQSELSTISNEHAKIMTYANDVSSSLVVIDQVKSSLRSQLDNLRRMTPETPVNFYAYLSSSYITPNNKTNIIFNARQQYTDSAYSPSTGVFTTPVNGTYYFRTAVTGISNLHTYASLSVNGQEVSSLHAFDDYSTQQATASAVVELLVGDAVSVVKKTGTRIYGVVTVNHISYFMGMLLW